MEIIKLKFGNVITNSPGSGPVIDDPDSDEEISGGGWN